LPDEPIRSEIIVVRPLTARRKRIESCPVEEHLAYDRDKVAHLQSRDSGGEIQNSAASKKHCGGGHLNENGGDDSDQKPHLKCGAGDNAYCKIESEQMEQRCLPDLPTQVKQPHLSPRKQPTSAAKIRATTRK
jgi:hypothetical protein